jgi:CheY-like chemotaxis protein
MRLIVSIPPRSRDDDAVAPAAVTVLLVDREALYRWFVAESLRACGIDVVSCGSPAEALALLRRQAAPDLLIVDGEMLGGDAGTLAAMRAGAGAAPCLVLDSGDLAASGLDAVTVAVKPVDTTAVVALVTRELHRDVPAA